jgi:hypothetical protein
MRGDYRDRDRDRSRRNYSHRHRNSDYQSVVATIEVNSRWIHLTATVKEFNRLQLHRRHYHHASLFRKGALRSKHDSLCHAMSQQNRQLMDMAMDNPVTGQHHHRLYHRGRCMENIRRQAPSKDHMTRGSGLWAKSQSRGWSVTRAQM